MALFKILRGSFNDLNTKIQNTHDGYAYFTPDTKGFYIDAGDKRLKINERAIINSYTLMGNNWNESSYYDNKISIPTSLQNDYYVEINFDFNNITEDTELLFEIAKANLVYNIDNENGISFQSKGIAPENINIPLVIKFIPKEMEGAY